VERDEAGLERARKAKDATERLCRELPCVNGIGITRVDGRYAVKVSLSEPAKTELPESVGGVPLVVEVAGRIRKQSARPRRS
jgi:hypothetical protein